MPDEIKDMFEPSPETEESLNQEAVTAKPPAPPAAAPQKPTILQKIDEILGHAKPSLVEKIRRIRADDTIRFGGMTRREIDDKFNVAITGGENAAQLRAVQATVVTLRREASSHLRNALARKSLLRNAYDSAKDVVDSELVVSNLTAQLARDKISDKARETIARQVYTINDGEGADDLAYAIAETSFWESIVDDMDTTLRAIQNDLMTIASENKLNVPR